MLSHRKRSAGVLLLSSALIAGGGLLSSASAAPVIPDADPSGGYSLTVHKHVGPQNAAIVPDGTEQTITNAALPGADFEIIRILGYDRNANGTLDSDETFDLHTEAGWNNAATLSYAEVTAAVQSTVLAAGDNVLLYTDKDDSGVTNSSGIIDYTGKPAGLYLVTETAAPTGYAKAVPFLVTLPMTNPTGTSWMNHVHVYPKNTPPLNVDKKITNATWTDDVANGKVPPLGTPLGNINYVLKSDIPKISPTDDVTKYIVTDTLDSKLTFTDPTGWNDADLICTSPASATSLSIGDATKDISVLYTAPAGSTLATLRWTLNASGLAKINDKIHAAQLTCQVVLNFTARANSLGDIPNGGPDAPQGKTTLVWGTATGDEPPIIYPPVVTSFGGEALHKFDFTKSFGQSGYNLAGAKFMLFKSATDARACNPVETAGVWACDGGSGVTPVQFYTNAVISGVVQNGFVDTNANGIKDGTEQGEKPDYSVSALTNVATSAADGTAYICGLAYGTYYVLEVQAPSGSGVNNGNFELLSDPFAISIDKALDFSAWTGANTRDDTGVANVPDNGGFQLPLTGGHGTEFLMVLSVGIAAVGTTAVLVRRKAKAIA